MKAARRDFLEDMPDFPIDDLIVLDEVGGETGMSRAYAYAPCGERAVVSEPSGKGTRLSLIGAISMTGFLGGLDVEETVNGEVFEACVEQILVPQLTPNKIVL